MAAVTNIAMELFAKLLGGWNPFDRKHRVAKKGAAAFKLHLKILKSVAVGRSIIKLHKNLEKTQNNSSCNGRHRTLRARNIRAMAVLVSIQRGLLRDIHRDYVRLHPAISVLDVAQFAALGDPRSAKWPHIENLYFKYSGSRLPTSFRRFSGMFADHANVGAVRPWLESHASNLALNSSTDKYLSSKQARDDLRKLEVTARSLGDAVRKNIPLEDLLAEV